MKAHAKAVMGEVALRFGESRHHLSHAHFWSSWFTGG